MDIIKKVLTISKWDIFHRIEESHLIDMWNDTLLLAIRISSVDIVLDIIESISRFMNYSIMQEKEILYYTKKYKGITVMKKVDGFLMYADLTPKLGTGDAEIVIPSLFEGYNE
jgi:hypothetical protein